MPRAAASGSDSLLHTPANIELAEYVSYKFFNDPMGFVMFAYPWDTNPAIQMVELEEPWTSRYNCKYGPDKWACEFLDRLGKHVKEHAFDGRTPVPPVRMGVSSGHGIGKSALTGWLVNWIMSTRPYAQGTVTAGTGPQLSTRTWPQIVKWTKHCITGHWFNINTGRGNMIMYHPNYAEEWFCSAQTCREENSESFAGQHAANSTSFYIFDEASVVPDKIKEVAEGGLTDGQPMMFAFGNPTRNEGWFREVFGGMSKRWDGMQVDSRSCQLSNKTLIAEWAQDYGEDHDFFRVRVRGVFPRVSDMQFISSELVEQARRNDLTVQQFGQYPRVMGVDVARFGSDNSVIAKRQGPKIFPLRKFNGIDTMQLVGYVYEEYLEYKPMAVFVDGTGLGGGVVDRLRQLGVPVVDVQFGERAVNQSMYSNIRTEIWGNYRSWLGGVVDIPDDSDLVKDTSGVMYGYDGKMRMALERKQDTRSRPGMGSPDCGDAVAVTFAEFTQARAAPKVRTVRPRKF